MRKLKIYPVQQIQAAALEDSRALPLSEAHAKAAMYLVNITG
jgi:hypothetical protein